MGSKRDRDDHESHGSTAQTKKRKFNPAHKRNQHNSGKNDDTSRSKESNPLNPLRSRIRSLKRLLAHDDAVDAALLSRDKSSFPSHGGPQQQQQQQQQQEQRTFLHSTDELEVAAKHEARDQRRAKRLPAQIRLEHERELAGLEDRVAEILAKKRRSQLIGKWHMVRFFERRRAERVAKRLRKELKSATGEGEEGQDGRVEALRAQIEEAEIARAYSVYYPLERPYVSLWPRRKTEGDGGAAKDKDDERGVGGEGWEKPVGDVEMWELVKQCLGDGRLNDLREGRIAGSLGEAQASGRARPANGSFVPGRGRVTSRGDGVSGETATNRKALGAAARAQDADDDSDGGFFEE